MNYFELLDIEEKYNLDLQYLRQQYLLKLATYHPDKSLNAAEKNKYQDISINLNKAYTTLKDDIKRAEHFLSLKGIYVDDVLGSKLSNEELSKIWEDREKIESMNIVEDLKHFLQEKILQHQQLIKHLNDAFKNKHYEEALNIVISFKYLTNLIENIKLKIKDADNRN